MLFIEFISRKNRYVNKIKNILVFKYGCYGVCYGLYFDFCFICFRYVFNDEGIIFIIIILNFLYLIWVIIVFE